MSVLTKENLCLDLEKQNSSSFFDNTEQIRLQALRCSCFALFTTTDSSKEFELGPWASELPSIGTEITNICSPFGISAKELFYNISYQGIISNYI